MSAAEFLDIALKVSTFVLSIGAMVYAFFATRRKDTDSRFQKVEGRLTDVERIAAASPASEDLHAISLSLAEMRGEWRVVSAELKGQRDLMARLDDVVTRHEEHLLKGAK